jgi:hypothetical protein
MAANRTEAVAGLTRTLRSTRNVDGGWAYFAGKSSRLEPTCWAILSLLDSGDEFPLGQLDASLALLSRWQQRDGFLSDTPNAPPNMAFNGLAALVVRRVRERHPAGVPSQEAVEERLLMGLRAIRGARIGPSPLTPQGDRSQGWPWIDQTFTWVEPTAWCLLALKKARHALSDPRFDTRIDEGDRMLLDQCCQVGGWNYGNSEILGKQLHPYVPTTALGLLALQDRRETPEVTRSLGWLRDHQASEPSKSAFSMALMAARVFGEPAEPVDAKLQEQAAGTEGLGNLATTGLALYALTGARHRTDALRL